MLPPARVPLRMNQPSPEPNRPDRPEQKDGDLSGLLAPGDSPLLMSQHLLHAAYLEWARGGFSGENRLIEGRREFTFEDLKVFSVLEQEARRDALASIRTSGIGLDERTLQFRCLHRLVAVGDSGRERHVYVEILSDRQKAVLAHQGTAQVFSEGPVALHVYSPDETSPGSVVHRQLVSRQAFAEGLVSMLRDQEAGKSVHLAQSWAWRWGLEVVPSISKELRSVRSTDGSGQSGMMIGCRLVPKSSSSLKLLIKKDSGACSVLLEHNERRQEPKVTIFSSGARQEPGR